MKFESSNKIKQKSLSSLSKNNKPNLICKDGFCTLPSQKENESKIENNMNLFDPI